MGIIQHFNVQNFLLLLLFCSSQSSDIPMMRRAAKKKFSDVADICKAEHQPCPPALAPLLTWDTNSQISEAAVISIYHLAPSGYLQEGNRSTTRRHTPAVVTCRAVLW